MEESEGNGSDSIRLRKPSKEDEESTINTWLDVFKIPSITGGHFTEKQHFIDISTTWSVKDAAKKESVSFNRSFSVLKSSLIWNDGEDVIDDDRVIINSTAGVPFDGKQVCISNDGSRKAILTDKKPSGETVVGGKTEFLQIWSSESLLKSYDLNELDKHKLVYTAGAAAFGTMMAWSPDSKKVAYLAEKKIPKSKPFFTSNIKKDMEPSDTDNTKDEKNSTRGEEYAFKQSWGEQLKDMYFSVIVILDTETDNFEVITLPEGEFPTDIQWLNELSILGLSYKIPVWRLGLIHCTNRESRIFRIDVDGKKLRFLSVAGRAVRSPRVKPGGKYCIWQERAIDGPHKRAMAIMGLYLPDEGEKEDNWNPDPECIYESAPSNDIPVYLDFPKNCWTPDGSTFFFLTPNEGIMKVVMVSFTKGTPVVTEVFKDIGQAGINGILWIGDRYMLITKSSILQTPFMELVDISEVCELENPRRVIISKSMSTVSNPHTMTTEFVYGESTAPSIFIGPWPKNVESNSVPLIVISHGGPHSVFLDTFSIDDAFFLRLGFAILKLNYIGSLGSKQDETDKLLGYVGTMDTRDCQYITEKVLNGNPSLNPEQVFVFGGSHGGFLTGHLTSSYPEFYKAAVMMNPVCDFNVMVGTSDITDWVFAEAGIPLPVYIPTARSHEEAQKFMTCSPITNISKVQAPTLLLLGSEDLRVPMTQGLAYYRALKALNKTAEVRIYPDNHSLFNVPIWTDSMIHTALWFKKFMK